MQRLKSQEIRKFPHAVALYSCYLSFQEPEDSSWPIVPLERQGLGMYGEHAVQVAKNHICQQPVAHEA